MQSIVRGAAIYLVLLTIVRLAGRRTLAQLTPFDLVLILITSEAIQQAMLIDDYSITNAVLLVVTIFTIDIGLSYLKQAWLPLERWLDGSPTILVLDGKPIDAALRGTRVQVSDILQAARQVQGVERLEDIKSAVLEISGEISIVPAGESDT